MATKKISRRVRPSYIRRSDKVDGKESVIIKELEFRWAKLDPKKPVEPFGTLRWELQVCFSEDRVEEMEEFGMVKELEEPTELGNTHCLNLNKKAELADGSPAKHVRVLDADGDVMEDVTIIGNGSQGAVKLFLRDYQVKSPKGKVTKEGTVTQLLQVKVYELVEYIAKGDGLDFEEEEEEEDERHSKSSAKKASKKLTRYQELRRDDGEEEEEEEVKPAKKAAAKAPVRASSKKVDEEEGEGEEEDDEEEEERPARKPAKKATFKKNNRRNDTF